MALVPYSDDEDSDSEPAQSKGDGCHCVGATADGHDAAAGAEEAFRPAHRARCTEELVTAASPAVAASKGDTRAAEAQLIRNFPHQEGNFATTVFLPVCLTEPQRAVLQTIYDKLCAKVPTLRVAGWALASKLQALTEVPLEHHVSVSRTVALQYAQIETVIPALQHQLRRQSRIPVSFGALDLLVNDNTSRVFVSAMATDGVAEVCSIIQRVNKTFRPHKLSTFHEDPRPHISLAWDFSEQHANLASCVAAVNDAVVSQLPQQCIATVQVEKICCQVGQRQYTLWRAADRS